MAKKKTENDRMSRIVALCKRRGIVFQSSEIYGGVGSTFDYGPYGVEIKNNISRLWWNEMTLKNDNIVGLDSAVILHPKVWEASGHLTHFSDPMVDCTKCNSRFKIDAIPFSDAKIMLEQCTRKMESRMNLSGSEVQIYGRIVGKIQQKFGSTIRFDEVINRLNSGEQSVIDMFREIEAQIVPFLECPNCKLPGYLTIPRQFNLMFQTKIGALEEEEMISYFRPETCQGIFLDYKILQETARLKVPFGIAQVGKAFRNEITTQKFIFRTREFEQMEMEFFIKPGDNREWIDNWKKNRWDWYMSLGIDPARLRWHEHPKDKLAHYAREAWDIEYQFPFGWGEIEGIHDRGDYDLNAHQQASGKDLTYYDDQAKERYIPHIIETSAGLNRIMLMVLCESYREDEQAGEKRVLLSLNPKVAPIKAAILPLVKKDGLAEMGRELYNRLRGKWQMFYDEGGSIGRRYRRMDELGTPFAFTLDYQTKDDNTVTVRYRDTLEQKRIDKDSIGKFLEDELVL